MNAKEILNIIALSTLGLCLICSVSKMAMKSNKTKKECDRVCILLFFISVVLIGVSQLLHENDGYEAPGCAYIKDPQPCRKKGGINPKNHCSVCEYGYVDAGAHYEGEFTRCCTEDELVLGWEPRQAGEVINCITNCSGQDRDGKPNKSCDNEYFNVSFPKDDCPLPNRGVPCDTRTGYANHCSMCDLGYRNVGFPTYANWCCTQVDAVNGDCKTDCRYSCTLGPQDIRDCPYYNNLNIPPCEG